MPYTPDRLAGVALTTNLTTVLVTAGAAEKLIVRQILLTNTNNIDNNATIYVGPVRVAANLVVPAYSTVVLSLSQIVRATETIVGGAFATGVECLIAGVRIT